MLAFEDLLIKSAELMASDVHFTVGIPPTMRINGKLKHIGNEILMPRDIESYVKQILSEEQYIKYLETGELDLSYLIPGVCRFRVNVFRQRGSDAMALRMIALDVPTLSRLDMPAVVKELAQKTRGLILVTGPTGSGKSTTLAAMINEINLNRHCHIITLEDPIEYLHKHKKSIINQREIGYDTKSYGNALRAALREDPDVILVGEMRDLETISIAITAAETGHLVLSTLHTVGASNTIDRIVDVFPPHQQQQIKVQLSSVLEGVISQQLLKKANDEGRNCAMEIMVATPAIRNLIREGKTHQIDSAVQTGVKYGMKSMDVSLSELCNKGIISYEEAITHSIDKEMITRLINW